MIPRLINLSRLNSLQLVRRRCSFLKSDRGRERLLPSPPSEPCVRFSRTRLSSRWFPHRDWLASFQAVVMVNSPWAAKN